MIETARLILRDWRDDDHAPLHAMNSDPLVMATIGPAMSRAEVDAQIDRMVAANRQGAGLWAVERRSDGAFLGFCGIGRGPPGTPIADEAEIGWRLAHRFWGQGYAREAAQASINWAWATQGADSVSAITAVTNDRSWGLMERLGMTRYLDEDFDHPAVPDDSPLKRHVVYRVARSKARPATP